MALDPVPHLATFAAIIGLGFLGYLLFERTRVTDVLLLIGVGVIVGPVLNLFSVSAFQGATALVGTLALIVIMFDGGLGLRVHDVVSGLGRSAVLAITGFVLTVGAVATIAHHWLAMDWMTATLLGVILGGTSGVIVMPIIQATSARPSTRVILSVESALTDVLCVIGAVTLIGLIATSGGMLASSDVQTAFKGIAAQFSIAIVLGMVMGFAWLRLLKVLEGRKYSYMLTLAAILAIYSAAEVMGGSGAIAVLIFGVVLGNGHILTRLFAFRGTEFSSNQRQFQTEITFLIRVFFFVYLGVILDPTVLWNPTFLLFSGLVLGGIIAARLVSTSLAMIGDKDGRGDRGLVAFMLPRGLAATVLAGMPAAAGIPGTQSFLAYAFIVVVATNLVSSAAVVLYERRNRRLATMTRVDTSAHPAASR